MSIKVRLFATLRNGRGKELIVNLETNRTPKEVIDGLGIPEEDVAILLVNGRDGVLDQLLNDGDTVSIFPPVGGG
ncbi:molybdopterin converting factor small subunit [Anaerosolibacter carboniphilus]|uniref:Molybdopterin converting factor small subunit n=1 Tax=Anaerosolibacter carboniphilus TaxID=1417629 RepID=A0A841KQW1_9FIRM|nr:MoaD/ThiS family protein [Anaerosolibacter carboniphilus]MBB6215803.1 molybdopterin converting factor small subunit [Anaerosolibacter carboniphilus]